MKSLNIDTNGGGGKARNPYGRPPSSSSSSLKNAVRSYLTFGLALFAIYGVGKVILPSGNKSDPRADAEWALKGDAAGGWGSQHHHPIRTSVSGTSKYSKPAVASSYSNAQYNAAAAAGEYDDDDVGSPVSPHYHEQKTPVGYGSDNDSDIAALEIKEADYLAVLAPIVRVPSHERKEYEMYQQVDADSGDGFANGESIGSGESIYAEEMLYDRGTPHGMAFDFLLNRDTRPANHDDPHLIQRFVLTLLFYSTGGTDETDPPRESDGPGGSSNGWDSSAAHFLTSLHECHWVKKSLEDSFWGMLAMESDTDRRVGVTKCNADLEVTEIRLADLNLIGFIPEEIKWLSSLESLDIQNNHITGPIPDSLGELDELNYLSLDGNNFSGTIPNVFAGLGNLERVYLNFNDFNGAMAPSLCTLREEGILTDLWSDCGGYPITCTCCTVCCDMVSECNEMESQKDD